MNERAAQVPALAATLGSTARAGEDDMRAYITIALAAAVIFVGTLTAEAATLRVPQDFATIQDAVNAAGVGDRIKIAKGTYSEQVDIDGKTDVLLLGSGPKTVIADGAIGVEIQSSTGITIRNLLIEDTAGAGIAIHDSADIGIWKCTIRDTGWHGIYSDDSTDLSINGCKLDNIGEDGITLSGDDGTDVCNDSVVAKCRITRCHDDGIVVRGARNLVTGCYIRDVGDDGVETKNWDDNDSDTLITKCRAFNAEDEGFQIQGWGTTVTKCLARDSGSDGFDVEANDCTISKCTSKKADSDAVETTGDGNRIEKCKGILSGDSGIRVEDGATHLEKNKLLKNAHVGVWLLPGAAGSTLIKNKASKSGEVDFYDETPPGSCTLVKNKFKTTGTP